MEEWRSAEDEVKCLSWCMLATSEAYGLFWPAISTSLPDVWLPPPPNEKYLLLTSAASGRTNTFCLWFVPTSGYLTSYSKSIDSTPPCPTLCSGLTFLPNWRLSLVWSFKLIVRICCWLLLRRSRTASGTLDGLLTLTRDCSLLITSFASISSCSSCWLSSYMTLYCYYCCSSVELRISTASSSASIIYCSCCF